VFNRFGWRIRYRSLYLNFMGIRISSLLALTKADIDIFDPSPPVIVVSYSGVSYKAPRGGFSDDAVVEEVNQVGHTFVIGDAVLKLSSGLYRLAIATVAASAADTPASDATGVVVAVGTGAYVGKFIVQFSGSINIGGVTGGRYPGALTVGSVYYLDKTTGGLCTVTFPANEEVIRPMFVALTSSRAIMTDDRARQLPGTPLYDEFVGNAGAFKVGDCVRHDGSTYVKAVADSLPHANAIGLVVLVSSSGTRYRVMYAGWATVGHLAGGTYTGDLVPGAVYYLSQTVAGLATPTKPPSGAAFPAFIALTVSKVLIYSAPSSDVTIGKSVTQAGHGFVIGDAVRSTTAAEKASLGKDWILAKATDDSEGQSIGVVTAIGVGALVNTFILQFYGTAIIGAVAGGRYTGNLQQSAVYYLDGVTAGNSTVTIPAPNLWRKPVFYAISSTEVVIIDDRGDSVSSTKMIAVPASTPGQGSMVVGMAMRYNGTAWVPSQADTPSNALVTAVVAKIVNSVYYLITAGVADIGNVGGGAYASPLTPGATYYLSDVTAGWCGTAVPLTNKISAPVFVAISTTRALLLHLVPQLTSENILTESVQSYPTLTVGMAVYLDNASHFYYPANAVAEMTSQVCGIVAAVQPNNTYQIARVGVVTAGLVAGGLYPAGFSTVGEVRYLTTNGNTTNVKPSAPNAWVKPVFITLSSSKLLIVDDRPVVIPVPYVPPDPVPPPVPSDWFTVYSAPWASADDGPYKIGTGTIAGSEILGITISGTDYYIPADLHKKGPAVVVPPCCDCQCDWL